MDEASAEIIKTILGIIPHVLRAGQKKIWIDYDDAADVMYINFRDQPHSVEHEEDENGIIWNYDEKGNLVGLSVMIASRFAQDEENSLELNEETKREMEEARAEIKAGKCHTFEEVKRELGLL